MTVTVAEKRGGDPAFDALPTLPLWRDEELIEMYPAAPQPAPGACVVRIESRSPHRRWVQAALALAGAGLALVGSVALRSRSASRSATPPPPQHPHSRHGISGSNAHRSAEARPGSRRRDRDMRRHTRRWPRMGARASRVRSPGSPARHLAAPHVEYTPPRPPAPIPVPATRRHGEEFGFER
jgi:hypothetical protein